jgi:hypothetical protein
MKLIVGVMLLMAAPAFAQNSPKDVPAACGAMKASFNADVQDGQHATGTVPAGKALVYFIHDMNVPGGQHFTVRMGVDGAWVGAYKQSSAFSVAVDPGEHHLCASTQSAFSIGKMIALAHFKAEAGKTYYFLTQLLSLYPAFPGLEFVQPDSDEGKYLIGTLPVAVWKEKK